MKKIGYLFVIISLIACGNSVIEKVEETYPDNSPKKVSYFQEMDEKEVLVEEKYFHENGTLKMGGKFVNGKREGAWKAYFDNEQLQSEGAFKDGKRSGLARVYYPNGKLRYEGQYENDKEVGHWKFYNEQGQLIEEKDF